MLYISMGAQKKQHDTLFRAMVSHWDARRDLVRICLPELAHHIDQDSITILDGGFSRGRQADLLLSMPYRMDPDRTMILIVEHKSYKDPRAGLQTYGYAAELMKTLWRSAGTGEPMPDIYTAVLYHGKTRWIPPETPPRFHPPNPEHTDQLHREELPDPETHNPSYPFQPLQPFRPTFRLVDLSRIEIETLPIAARTKAFLIAMSTVFLTHTRATAGKILRYITAQDIDESVQALLWRYLLDNTGKQNLDTLLTEWERVSYTVKGGEAMTAAQELIRRGKVEGREEGLKQGLQQGLKEAAHGMLAMGVSLDIIQASTGLTEEQIADVRVRTNTTAIADTQSSETHNRNTT